MKETTGLKFTEFCEVIERLRSEDGCAWDRAQTFESLKPCMINELTEAIAGIDLYRSTGDAENLKEELGDVLLQVVLLAQIAGEQGLFDMQEVIEGITAKMVRRHPHVFGSEEQRAQGMLPGMWEEIKREEKQGRTAEQERAQKAALHAAAGHVICHLSDV